MFPGVPFKPLHSESTLCPRRPRIPTNECLLMSVSWPCRQGRPQPPCRPPAFSPHLESSRKDLLDSLPSPKILPVVGLHSLPSPFLRNVLPLMLARDSMGPARPGCLWAGRGSFRARPQVTRCHLSVPSAADCRESACFTTQLWFGQGELASVFPFRVSLGMNHPGKLGFSEGEGKGEGGHSRAPPCPLPSWPGSRRRPPARPWASFHQEAEPQ